ncbi:hypothetical protein BV20DRAFT_639260 [Pilatotrama ljubarskyi]|nr:hypothetical protein BV20DRAFT_639260 [Pilatotrama ljubarskyi]
MCRRISQVLNVASCLLLLRPSESERQEDILVIIDDEPQPLQLIWESFERRIRAVTAVYLLHQCVSISDQFPRHLPHDVHGYRCGSGT